MNSPAPDMTASLGERPIRVCFVNNPDHSEFRLGHYLSERLPCLQDPDRKGEALCRLRWNAEQLGSIELSDTQTLEELERLQPPAQDFSPKATVKDAVARLGRWIVEAVQGRLAQPMVDALTHWLRDQWARYVPQSVLKQCDWKDYFWQCINLPNNAHLVVGGQDYGVLPCLAGHVEAHPFWLREGHEGDVHWKWRHYKIEEKAAGPHPQDANRSRYKFATFFTPAHLCDTLEYSFSSIECQTDANGKQVHHYERMDEGDDPWHPRLCFHFYRVNQASTFLTRSNGGAKNLVEPTDHWVIRDQELHGSLAAQHISEAMPHFVYQTLAMRLPPVLDSFQRQARNLIGSSRQLPEPIWLRSGQLRATLDAARIEWEQGFKPGRVSPESAFNHFLYADTPLSTELLRSLEWLEEVSTTGESPIPELQEINWWPRIILVANLAGQLRDLQLQRRQALIEAHRQLTGLFEGLLRTFFSHQSIVTRNRPNSGISILFCEWVASRDGRPSPRPRNNSPYSHAWYETIHDIIKNKLSTASRLPPPPLVDIIRGIAQSAANSTGNIQPGAFVDELLIFPPNEVGACAWIRRIAAACQLRSDCPGQPQDCTITNLMLIGLILIETRNLLTHGQEPLGVECPEGGVAVTSYADEMTVILDSESLEICFRLFVAATTLVCVVAGLNPLRLDHKQRNLPELERQKEQSRIDQDTTDRELFLRSG